MTGRLKRPVLVTSGSSHQPPSLTQRMDEQLCAGGEQYTQREREGESEIGGEAEKSGREYPMERAHEKSSVVELKFTLLMLSISQNCLYQSQ